MKTEFKEQLIISLYDFDEHLFQFTYDAFFQKYNLEYWELVKLVSESILELYEEGKIAVVRQNLSHNGNSIIIDSETILNLGEIIEWISHPVSWDRSANFNVDQWVVIRNIEG